MKKAIICFVALFTALNVCTGCAKTQTPADLLDNTYVLYYDPAVPDNRNLYEGRSDYTVKGASTGDGGVNGVSEETDVPWHAALFIAQDAPATLEKEIVFLNKTFHGTYSNSRYMFGTDFRTDTYSDENDNLVEIDEHRNITLFIRGRQEETDQSRKYAKNDCAEIARQTFLHFNSDTAYKFELDVERTTEEQYTFVFTKYVHGWKTADFARIGIDVYGNVQYYYATLLGRIPTEPLPPFRLEETDALVAEKLESMYAQAKGNFDIVRYEAYDYTLTMFEDDAYILICRVKVWCEKYITDDMVRTQGDIAEIVIR